MTKNEEKKKLAIENIAKMVNKVMPNASVHSRLAAEARLLDRKGYTDESEKRWLELLDYDNPRPSMVEQQEACVFLSSMLYEKEYKRAIEYIKLGLSMPVSTFTPTLRENYAIVQCIIGELPSAITLYIEAFDDYLLINKIQDGIHCLYEASWLFLKLGKIEEAGTTLHKYDFSKESGIYALKSRCLDIFIRRLSMDQGHSLKADIKKVKKGLSKLSTDQRLEDVYSMLQLCSKDKVTVKFLCTRALCKTLGTLVCSRCKRTYCSRECQGIDWMMHKNSCENEKIL